MCSWMSKDGFARRRLSGFANFYPAIFSWTRRRVGDISCLASSLTAAIGLAVGGEGEGRLPSAVVGFLVWLFSSGLALDTASKSDESVPVWAPAPTDSFLLFLLGAFSFSRL